MIKLILLTLFVVSVSLVNAQWQQTNGPYTGKIKCLAINGTNIFAGTAEGVFLSTNGANSWISRNVGLSTLEIQSLVISGTNLFAGTFFGGVFFSTNNGSSWTAINNGLTSTNVLSLAISGTNIFAGTNGGVFLSTNNGNTWTIMNTGLSNTYVYSLVVNGSNLFAGTNGGGVFISTDNGNTWTATGLNNKIVLSLATSGSNIFAGTTGGVLLSSDNGNTWTTVNTGLTNTIVNALTINGSNIFAGTNGGGVFLSNNNGSTWTTVNTGLTNKIIYSLGTDGTTIFAGSYIGMFSSSNNGSTWIEGNMGITNTISAVATKGDSIFAGTQDGTLFLSSDMGNLWTPVNTGITMDITSIIIIKNNIFVGTWGNGVIYSGDNGNSWSPKNSGLTTMYIDELAFNDTSIFAGTNAGIFLSQNNGSTWTGINNGLTSLYVSSIAFKGTNIFAGTSSGGVFLSTNNGSTWTAINNGLTATSIYSLKSMGTNIFAGTLNKGIFISKDNGNTWSPTSVSGTVFSLITYGNVIFAGTSSGGVFLSTDYGKTWEVSNTGLGISPVHSLVTNKTSIFAGLVRKGVWKRLLSDFTETKPFTTLNDTIPFSLSGVNVIFQSYSSSLPDDSLLITINKFDKNFSYSTVNDSIATVFNNIYWQFNSNIDTFSASIGITIDTSTLNTKYIQNLTCVYQETFGAPWKKINSPSLVQDNKIYFNTNHFSNWAIAIVKPELYIKRDTVFSNPSLSSKIQVEKEFQNTGLTLNFNLDANSTNTFNISRYDINPGGDIPTGYSELLETFWQVNSDRNDTTAIYIGLDSLKGYKENDKSKYKVLYRNSALNDWTEIRSSRVKKSLKEALFVKIDTTMNGQLIVGKSSSVMNIFKDSASVSNGCKGDTVKFTSFIEGGTPPFKYEWIGDDSLSSFSETAFHVYDNLGVFNFTLMVTDSTGASAVYDSQITIGCTDIQKKENMDITIYPNPAEGGTFTVNLKNIMEKGKISISVYDLLGREVYGVGINHDPGTNFSHVVKFDKKPKGLYLIVLQNENFMVRNFVTME